MSHNAALLACKQGALGRPLPRAGAPQARHNALVAAALQRVHGARTLLPQLQLLQQLVRDAVQLRGDYLRRARAAPVTTRSRAACAHARRQARRPAGQAHDWGPAQPQEQHSPDGNAAPACRACPPRPPRGSRAARLLAVAAALRQRADVGGRALALRLPAQRRAARGRAGEAAAAAATRGGGGRLLRQRLLAQVLLACAVLLKVGAPAAGFVAHLRAWGGLGMHAAGAACASAATPRSAGLQRAQPAGGRRRRALPI